MSSIHNISSVSLPSHSNEAPQTMAEKRNPKISKAVPNIFEFRVKVQIAQNFAKSPNSLQFRTLLPSMRNLVVNPNDRISLLLELFDIYSISMQSRRYEPYNRPRQDSNRQLHSLTTLSERTNTIYRYSTEGNSSRTQLPSHESQQFPVNEAGTAIKIITEIHKNIKREINGPDKDWTCDYSDIERMLLTEIRLATIKCEVEKLVKKEKTEEIIQAIENAAECFAILAQRHPTKSDWKIQSDEYMKLVRENRGEIAALTEPEDSTWWIPPPCIPNVFQNLGTGNASAASINFYSRGYETV